MANKHASYFCTDCLSSEGEYYRFKVLYERVSYRDENGKKKYRWENSGLYRCENCNRVAVEEDLYPEMRASNNHILKKLSTYLEE